MKNKEVKHGQKNFDRKYFGAYYKKYTFLELDKAYKWFQGWFRLINKIYPINKGRGKKVLEVGCGFGAFSKILREKQYNVFASDISSFIINHAKRLQKDINFTTEDVVKTQGKKNDYDLIFAFEVLEHLNSPKKALKNLYLRLKKGGMLIFSSPYPTKRTLADPTHINVHNPEEWTEWGKEIGFNKIRYQYVSFLPFLYRYHAFFSRAFSIKTNLPIVVNTCFFLFEK